MKIVNRYKVSVVTAVYNVEDYIAETIDSIIGQSIGFKENVQLILVDDGSSDTSGQICDEYASKYPENIIVIHKENGGVSSARNEGIKYVKGKYVNFLDSDDKLGSMALEKMIEFMERHEKEIDIVAIPIKFFGAKRGEHPLNYKFKKTRIIDLRKEYECSQLSLGSALIKAECLINRAFDVDLPYAEDAKLLVDILLDKMKYGVLNNTAFYYRKRVNEGSATDKCLEKKSWYSICVERFVIDTIENAISKKGYLPHFVQYECMYYLQWRMDKRIPAGVLTEEEFQEYERLFTKAIHYIDNEIIMKQKNIADYYKMYLLGLKEENRKIKEIDYLDNDIRICYGDTCSIKASEYSVVYESLKLTSEHLIIEGIIRCMSELDSIKVMFMNDANQELFHANVFVREEKETYYLDKKVVSAYGFKFVIDKKDIKSEESLKLFFEYQNYKVRCKNIIFGRFFPLDKKLLNAYFYDNGLLIQYEKCDNGLVLRKIKQKELMIYKKNLLKELLSKKDKNEKRGGVARILYEAINMKKKKEIWLISDRVMKADDNGEALFTYMNKNRREQNVETYFVLNRESEDYERLSKIGNVVSHESFKYKILCLLCDKIISSQADAIVFNRFFDNSYIYKDIISKQKFVFLQHGVTKDDISKWINKYNQNFAMIVSTTNDEYKAFHNPEYYYNENQIKLTGFPRYDFLEDKSENVITIMPTWRAYLVSKMNLHTGERELQESALSSTYFSMYKEVFDSNKLFDAASKYGYKIQFMMHPSMPKDSIKHFVNHKEVKIVDSMTRYRDVFAESKLVITDYSSAVFDFAYLRKPVLYYQADKDEFFSGKHTYDKGYYDYERDGFGEVEYTADDLVNRIIEYMEMDCQLKDKYRKRIDATFPYNDKNNCERVFEEIRKV